MSASSKKKLRKEAVAAELTEKQQREQAEAKKLKIMTISFVTVLALIVCIAVGVMIAKTVNVSGIKQRNTLALTVGDHELSSTEFNYYYMDAVNNFYSNLYSSYGDDVATYAELFYGLDCSTPLDEQYYNEETGDTWADYFISLAKSNAQYNYAMYDEAKANGYTMSEDEEASVDSALASLDQIVAVYGFSDVDTYLRSKYGEGAQLKTYEEYYRLSAYASAYYTSYAQSLDYTDDELRAGEAENPEMYNAYSYATVYLSKSNYLDLVMDTTEDSDDSSEDATDATEATPTDEDYEKALALAKADAEALVAASTSVLTLDKAYAALEINAEKEDAASTKHEDIDYSSISNVLRDWLTDSSREADDVGLIPYTYSTTDDDGNAVEDTYGYYVVVFQGVNDNVYPLANVRHILIAPEGGTTDDDGNTTYSDDELAAAKQEAEDLLAQWQSGDATEESFAELANEYSDDTSSNENGGLYEDILPGQTAEEFEDWCFDESRKAGDAEVIESSFGYHVMYYCSDSDVTYRDYLISTDLKTAAVTEWYNALLEKTVVTDGDLSLITTGLTLNVS